MRKQEDLELAAPPEGIHYYMGPTADAALAQARLELGDTAVMVGRPEPIAVGGVGGFFAHRAVRIMVAKRPNDPEDDIGKKSGSREPIPPVPVPVQDAIKVWNETRDNGQQAMQETLAELEQVEFPPDNEILYRESAATPEPPAPTEPAEAVREELSAVEPSAHVATIATPPLPAAEEPRTVAEALSRSQESMKRTEEERVEEQETIATQLAEQLHDQGLSQAWAESIALEVSTVYPRDIDLGLQLSLARRLKAFDLTPILESKALFVVGAPGSGKSTLAAQLGVMLARSGRRVAIASVGPWDDPGVEAVREAAHRAGIFFTWASTIGDSSLGRLASSADTLVVDVQRLDAAEERELMTLRRRLRKTQTIQSVSGAVAPERLADELARWRPLTQALALMPGPRGSAPGTLIEALAKERRPLVFLGAHTGGELEVADAPLIARLLTTPGRLRRN